MEEDGNTKHYNPAPAAQGNLNIVTKELDFELPSTDKKFYKVYITHIGGDNMQLYAAYNGASPVNGSIFTVDNFTTEFSFLEETGAMGNSNFLENNTSFYIDENNYITFKTRRNRKLNLTEYYDLVYEYQNDCLIAGIKYKKSYYEDRDLKPSENLFFTISLIPLTNYEQKVDR